MKEASFFAEVDDRVARIDRCGTTVAVVSPSITQSMERMSGLSTFRENVREQGLLTGRIVSRMVRGFGGPLLITTRSFN